MVTIVKTLGLKNTKLVTVNSELTSARFNI